MSTQSSASKIVLAAGGVLWRPGHRESAAEVAVIHRPRYDDWSLPKGKVDPGETEPVTAAREVFEETGHHVQLGRRIASVSYPIEQRTKKVQYWSARSLGGSFAPNNEVDELIWLPVAAAIKKVSYPYDRKVLRRWAKQPADTKSVLIVRHGTAGSKSRFSGDDKIRPLGQEGPGAGRSARRPAGDLRSHRCLFRGSRALPPDSGTARRGAGRHHQQRAGPDRRVVRRQPEAGSTASATDRGFASHAGDLHSGQGDSGPDRLVVRARRGTPGQVAQPQGQYLGAVAGQRPADRGRSHRQRAGRPT